MRFIIFLSILVKERQPDAKPPSPVKTRKSHSPHKSKRRSFNTPRKSPKDAYLYTPPVTRSSAKKITPSAKPLKEIGESSLLRYTHWYFFVLNLILSSHLKTYFCPNISMICLPLSQFLLHCLPFLFLNCHQDKF